MSYQVLARKWRPQTFSELVGQQHVVDAITNALENNKLHHAYLFTGTRGVGKTTIARIFSKSLNCEEGQSANPCGKCDTCLDISEGRFVDLLEIDAASRTKVEDTRELLDNVQYKPTRGKFKVYLIDEVHMLSKHSFNALLKTLEEPPPHVKFLLATTDPQKLPVTILSRCLQFSLKALSREQIQAQLAHILGEEAIEFDTQAISQIARAASGSMRDALSLTDQAIAQGNNQVSNAVVVSMLGLMDKNHLIKLAKFICERDANSAMSQLEEICADAPDYSQVLSQLLSLLHQIALTQIVPDICKLDTNSAKPIYTLAKSVNPDHIQLLYQIGLNGKRDLPFAPDAFSGLQMTVMRMLAFSPAQTQVLDLGELKADQSQFPVDIAESSGPSAIEEEPSVQESSKSQDAAYDEGGTANSTLLDGAPNEESPQDALSQDESQLDRPPYEAPIQDAPTAEIPTQNVPSQDSEMRESSPLGGFEASAHEEQEVPSDDSRDTGHIQVPSEQESSGHDSTDSDPVSQLQDLFAMEDDLASYEQQLQDAEQSTDVGQNMTDGVPSGKKSEAGNEQGAEHPEVDAESQIDAIVAEPLEASINRDVVHIDAERQQANMSDSQPQEEYSSQLESSAPPWHDDVPEHIGQSEEAESAAKTQDSLQLNPRLENGEKLVSAAQIDKWSRFVDALNVRGLARQLLIHGRSTGIKDKHMVIEIHKDNHHLNEQSSINSIRQALKEQYQQDISLEVQYADVENSPYEIQQAIDAMRLAHAKDVIHNDSAIQELRKAFDAQVINDSIEFR